MKTVNMLALAALTLCAAHSFAATHTEVTKAPRLPFMRGINFTGWPSGYATDSYATKASTYASLKTMGFDHVRVPIDFRRFTNYDSSTRTATFKSGVSTIDTVIDCAEAAGMYVYVDGTHGWKNDLDPRSESVTNQFIAIWKAVAERYKDRSNFVVFELMSEQKKLDDQILFSQYSALQNAAIAEIRKTNPTRLIIWSAHDGSQPWVLTQSNFGWMMLPKNDNNIAVAVHCYNPSKFTHQGQTWAGESGGQVRLTEEHCSTLRWDLDQITAYMEGTGIPVVLNEFGVVRSPADHTDIPAFLSIATRYCESKGVPWCPWVYGNSDVFACFDSSGEMLDYYKASYFPDLKQTKEFSASDYPHAIDITFSGYSGSGALANFPVLVKLSEEGVYGFRYSDFTRADGYDLCFTDSSGNLLAHEIDTWNTNGVSTAWVKVPSLTASTRIVARYGCAKPIVHKVESVWDENYVGVWHMGEQKLPLADSSNVSRDVTSADGTGIGYGAAGVVGGSVDFGAPGGSRCVNTDDHKELDGFQKMTIEAWTYQTARPTGSDKNTGILGKRNSSSSEASYYLYDSGADQKSAFYVASSGSSPQSAGKLVPTALNTWNHQVHTFDGSLSSDNAKGYLNGAYQGAGTANVSQIFAGAAELHIGNFQSGDSRNFPGKIDEVRISKCVRSADWIKASYDTVAKSSFAKYAVQDVVDQNPTLYVDVPTGEDTVDAAEVKTWTTKILKAGGGTAVFSPVSSASITNLEVRGGTVKLSSSAPASVVSNIGEHDFAAGTKLDLSGKSYSVATLNGQPTVQDAATFTVTGTWFMKGAAPMAVAGALAFGSGATVLLDESLFASVGHEGVAIATATGGITGMPAFESLDFAIKLSADGKSLIVYDNIPDVADWTAFTKAVAVTFSGVQNGVTLTNFPVLVKLSTAIEGFSYADFKRSNGEDLRFADSAGNLLAHEIDTWNPNGVSTVWVKVPLLSKDIAITAYYGNLHPVRAIAAKNVWDDDYVGVWHLGESALPMKESSETSSDFTSSYGDTIGYAAQGIVGGSVDFPTNGLYNALVAQDHDALDGFSKFTIETWTFQNEHKNNAGIISKRKESNSEAAYYISDTTNNSVMVLNIGTNRSTSALWSIHQAQTVGAWNHIAFTADMSSTNKNLHVFKNGAMNGWEPSKVFFGPVPNCASDLYLGNLGANKKDYSFNGKIDEVRISKCVRTPAWVKATYDTIASDGFATYELQAGGDPGPNPEADPVWSNFSKFMTVFFRGVQQGVSLTNFPVLVKLSTAIDGFSYADFKKPNGGDLRFADSSGNFLPHEIDTWNPNGVSTVWVKVPVLSHAEKITAYYGATIPGRSPAAKDVWDDDYVGVWHLGESAVPLKESSETSSDFTTAYGSSIAYAAEGIVGGSVDFSANGQYNSIAAPDHDALDGFSTFTLETWTRQDAHKSNAGILGKRGGYNVETAYYLFDSGSTVPLCVPTNKNVGTDWTYHQAQTLGEWNYLAYTVDTTKSASNVHGVKNGVSSTWYVSRDLHGPMANCASDLCLGNMYVNNKDYSFNGKIDEVRISKTVRSDAWLKATYDTIASSLSLYRVGETELPSDTCVSNLLLKAETDRENPIDYKEGDPITFNFRLEGVDMLPQEVQVKQPIYVIWTRTADDGVTVKGTNTISLTQGFSATTSLAIPGIVRMTGDLVGSDYKKFSYIDPKDGKTTKYVSFGGGAGVATEKMQLSSVEPADFDQFWREAKQKLATVPFTTGGSELTEVFPKTSNTNSYRYFAAKIPCYGPRPVTGWIIMPRNPQSGGVPIQANFDGYGCISQAPNLPTGSVGQKVYFAVNAHGYDMIGHNDQYYKDFSDYINYTNRTFNGTRYGYALAPQDYDNPTNTYFYYMAMRVMRAFDYLKTRPEWNGRDVIAEGGSQGGLQTMWAGGLVDGITKIRPGITWGCDIGDPYPNNPGPLLSRSWGIPSVEGAFYFDSALHAKRVPRTCIANITRLGMGDYTCPPRGVLLSYYNMKCQVSAYLVQGSDHGYIPPAPNQTFTIQKAAEPEPPPPPSAVASDAAGFDYTNRVVTVTNAAAGATLTLTATASDGTTTSATATADANGEATFDIATLPGTAYDYIVEQDGVAAATGGFFTGGWDAGGAWFSASAESGSSVVSGGDWKDSAPRIESGKYIVGDAAAEFGLSPAAAEAGSNGFVRIDFACAFDSFCDAVGLAGATEDGIVVFTAATNAATGGKALWMTYGSGGWKPLYGDIAPEEGASYGVRAEVDLAANPPRVRYSVRADAGDVFVPLFMDDARTERWCAGAESRAAVSAVSFDGSGSVTSLLGALSNSDVAEADGVGYASLADAIAASTNRLALLTNATWPTNTPVGTVAVNLGGYSLAGVTLDGSGKVVVGDGYSAIPGEGKINISLAQAAALGVSTDGKSPAQIASALAENGANGIPRWKSYALGLDPADATAKPKATIAMNGDTVELRLVGITVNTASGATVTYKAYKSADLADMANAEPASGDKAVDATASVPKGASEDRMFYQLKVDVKGY